MSDRSYKPAPGDDAQGGVTCEYVQDLAEGYVLDAVEPLERARIAAHLETCAECRALIAGLLRVVTVLPLLAVEQLPPADTKAVLMARLTRARPEDTPTSIDQRASATVLERSERFHPALTVLPMAAAVVLAIVWSFSLQQRLNQSEDHLADTQQADVMAVLRAPAGPSSWYSLKPICTGCPAGAELMVDSGRNMVMLSAWGLDPAKAHEVWAMSGNDQKQRVDTLAVSPSGAVMQALPLSLPLSSHQALMIMSMPEGRSASNGTPELMVEPAARVQPSGGVMMLAS